MPASGQIREPGRQEAPRPLDDAGSDKKACGQILKASALIGGASLAGILIGMVRTKAMAVLLGPAGFGLMGLYNSITDLASSIATLGVNSSGVRQMAEAAGSGKPEQLARTAVVLRRISVLLGLLGAGLLALLAGQVSNWTFASDEHGDSIVVLSFVVFFACVAGGQGALIQGMRRIGDLAKMGILGSVLGTAISIPIVYLYGERGVVFALVGIAAMGALLSWWYARKIPLAAISLDASEVGRHAVELLKLGFAFMASALMMSGAAYVVRLILLQRAGVEAAGFYQSAWTLGGLYVGFILQAMGTDFYPRLTGVAKDNEACNRMVNEQAQVSLLLAGPGIIATLTFSPLIIELFYSAKFTGAAEILRWICLGMALRVVIWPIGFIILAKGAQGFFFWTELAWTVVHLGLAWVCVGIFGGAGAGIAFFGSYVFHGALIYPCVRHLTGFRWSAANRQTGLLFLVLITPVFYSLLMHSFPVGMAVGALATLLSGIYSLRALVSLVPVEEMPRPIQRLLALCRMRRHASSE